MTTFAQPIYGAPKLLQPDGFLSSNYVRSNIDQFADKANDLANQLLAPANSSYTGPVIIRNNHYYSYSPFYSPWFYSRPSVIVVNNNGRNRRSNEQDNGKNALLGVVLTVGAVIMSYFIGTAFSSYQDAQRECKEARGSHKKFANFQAYVSPKDYPLLDEARIATGLKDRICSRIRDSALWDLSLRTAVTAGLVLGALGAFSICPPVVGILGLAICTTSAAAMMFKWGFDSTDRANIRDAQELRISAANIKQIISHS
ncbi:MAG TPA: hypothetical protein VGP47_10245 [Parachlamydiaceae bacterium]|nr:hypothetical protein [Parachlamydiaceae bacterium]